MALDCIENQMALFITDNGNKISDMEKVHSKILIIVISGLGKMEIWMKAYTDMQKDQCFVVILSK